MSETLHFYTQLPLQKYTISELLRHPEAFHQVPEDWSVIVTDIKNSTGAVRAGKHRTVNLVATGSIVSSINLAKNRGVSIPFFFGGDGATLMVPEALKEVTMQALLEHRSNSQANFELDLRVGCMAVAELYQHGKKLQISKVALEKGFNIPLVIGDGLRYAESIIKKDSFQNEISEAPKPLLDLEGMACRWDIVEPPEKRLEVVCLLIDALVLEQQRETFQEVMSQIDDIYGLPQQRKPLSIQQLKLTASWERVAAEAKVKFGHRVFIYQLFNWLLSSFGRLYFDLLPSARKYLKQLVEWSDTLVIDGRIHTVITGTADQRAQLVDKLDTMEKEGKLLYGIYISPESIMSCYVRKKDWQHIHFVDGSDGGYTKAAGVLKKKWKAFEEF